MPLTLPPEICSAICDELKESTGTLAFLCRTSRDFCHQAQRLLYRSVDLRGRDLRAVRSWARAVTRHAHLAERMYALALELPDIRDIDPETDTTKIIRALGRCVNLKELRITGEEDSGVHGWIISDYPFRLEKFESLPTLLSFFWKTQTQIRVLSLPNCRHLPSFEDELLDVIALGVPSLSDLPARPLQRIETRFHDDFSPLAQYSRTLTTLSIRVPAREWVESSLYSLADIAASVPALVHLSIAELKKASINVFPYATSPIQIMRDKFQVLETFVLQVRNIEGFFGEAQAPHYNMALADDVQALGAAILNACPTLLRAAIGTEVEIGEQLTCVLTRTSGGEIHADAGTDFHTLEALSMFWNP
ncbi:hypothetical protein K438DRAFT_1840400 [Mycena galopus ATCC 62051]|nr:hypothetical protein K438DRAFT_1840400 [Mycena galopus ATCC 62051]